LKKATVLILAIILLLTGCSTEQNTELEESINSVIEDKNNNEININTLTTFDWNEAHLFAPYTTSEGIEEQLGFKYRDKSNIRWKDDIFLLVFVKDDKAIQYAEIDHQGSNLSIKGQSYLTPLEDVIHIDRY
jgi:major membrane immunogen (membrane-anchored lipoprotein)